MKSTGETSSVIVQQPEYFKVLKLERWVPLFKVSLVMGVMRLFLRLEGRTNEIIFQ